jgi:hypothetical protein
VASIPGTPVGLGGAVSVDSAPTGRGGVVAVVAGARVVDGWVTMAVVGAGAMDDVVPDAALEHPASTTIPTRPATADRRALRSLP